jgi:large subunit ribosomal protein L6
MSRIGKLPVPIPNGVKCELAGRRLKVTGPKGSLEMDLVPDVTVTVEDENVTVARPSDKPDHRAMHGLARALINNMVTGVTDGYEKQLEIQGVGYRASMQGKALNLAVGYSHPVSIDPPEGIAFEVDGTQIVKVIGIDKQLVGHTAAKIRAVRKPEPYKGKGIRYVGERVRRKVGKTGVGGK